MAIEKYDPSDPKVIHKRILEYVKTANSLCQKKGVSELSEKDGIQFLVGVSGYGQFVVPLHEEIDGQVYDYNVMVLHYGYIDSSEFTVLKENIPVYNITLDETSHDNSVQPNKNFIISTLNKISEFLLRQQNMEHSETEHHI